MAAFQTSFCSIGLTAPSTQMSKKQKFRYAICKTPRHGFRFMHVYKYKLKKHKRRKPSRCNRHRRYEFVSDNGTKVTIGIKLLNKIFKRIPN